MKEEFAPYDIALAMKELGFDEDVCGFHSKDKGLLIVSPEYNDVIKLLKAPLYQQAFRWFREEYKLFGVVIDELTYTFSINNKSYSDYFLTANYQEAQDACLRKLIEIVKEKQHGNN